MATETSLSDPTKQAMETSSGLDCLGPVRLSCPADVLDSNVNCGEDFEDNITLASAFQGRQDVLPVPAHRAAGTGQQPTWRAEDAGRADI